MLPLRVNIINNPDKNTSHKKGRPLIFKGGLFIGDKEFLKLLDGVSNLNRDGNLQFSRTDRR